MNLGKQSYHRYALSFSKCDSCFLSLMQHGTYSTQIDHRLHNIIFIFIKNTEPASLLILTLQTAAKRRVSPPVSLTPSPGYSGCHDIIGIFLRDTFWMSAWLSHLKTVPVNGLINPVASQSYYHFGLKGTIP